MIDYSRRTALLDAFVLVSLLGYGTCIDRIEDLRCNDPYGRVDALHFSCMIGDSQISTSISRAWSTRTSVTERKPCTTAGKRAGRLLWLWRVKKISVSICFTQVDWASCFSYPGRLWDPSPFQQAGRCCSFVVGPELTGHDLA